MNLHVIYIRRSQISSIRYKNVIKYMLLKHHFFFYKSNSAIKLILLLKQNFQELFPGLYLQAFCVITSLNRKQLFLLLLILFLCDLQFILIYLKKIIIIIRGNANISIKRYIFDVVMSINFARWIDKWIKHVIIIIIQC